jgi:hypothetical protein
MTTRSSSLAAASAAAAVVLVVIAIAISCHRPMYDGRWAIATTGGGRRRRLLGGMGLRSFLDPRTVVEKRTSVAVVRPSGFPKRGDGGDNTRPSSSMSSPSSSSSSSHRQYPPYDVDDAISSAFWFRYTYFFLIYDSTNDAFVVVHNAPACDYGCARVHRLASTLSYALRLHFPNRIVRRRRRRPVDDDDDNDLVLMLSCGDAPRIKQPCLEDDVACARSSLTFPPILQFGSTFRDYFPTMIAMPLPVRPHMPCFDEWQVEGTLCRDLLPMTSSTNRDDAADDVGMTTNNGSTMGAVDALRSEIKGGLPYGVELGMMPSPMDDASSYWDDLIPQVIWRGTDFQYLHTMYPDMRPATYDDDIAPYLSKDAKFDNEYDRRQWAIRTLWGMGDRDLLLPRWRGVLLTSEAELEAEAAMEMQGGGRRNDATILPWVNIKFANVVNANKMKIPASQHEEYLALREWGISAIGEYVSMVEQARYKYHIDLGGGGGTTWTGTIEKLAMPGLLFHHVTPTKDWFHDLLVPWEHYVPVSADLSDLRRKYEWAESHPVEARRIAENGTRFARWMGSPEGFGRLYEEYLVGPLRNAIMAYRPMPPRDRVGHSRDGKSLLDVIIDGGEGKFKVVSRCTGLPGTSCEEAQS